MQLHTCSGGMLPYGFSTDFFSGNSPKWFPVGPGPDGFSQDFVFEARARQGLEVALCRGDSSVSQSTSARGTM